MAPAAEEEFTQNLSEVELNPSACDIKPAAHSKGHRDRGKRVSWAESAQDTRRSPSNGTDFGPQAEQQAGGYPSGEGDIWSSWVRALQQAWDGHDYRERGEMSPLRKRSEMAPLPERREMSPHLHAELHASARAAPSVCNSSSACSSPFFLSNVVEALQQAMRADSLSGCDISLAHTSGEGAKRAL